MAILFGGAETFGNYDKGHHKEQFCEICFYFGHGFQEDMPFKYISNLQLWWSFSSSAERTRHLGNFRRGFRRCLGDNALIS